MYDQTTYPRPPSGHGPRSSRWAVALLTLLTCLSFGAIAYATTPAPTVLGLGFAAEQSSTAGPADGPNCLGPDVGPPPARPQTDPPPTVSKSDPPPCNLHAGPVCRDDSREGSIEPRRLMSVTCLDPTTCPPPQVTVHRPTHCTDPTSCPPPPRAATHRPSAHCTDPTTCPPPPVVAQFTRGDEPKCVLGAPNGGICPPPPGKFEVSV